VLAQALPSTAYWDSVLKESRRPPLKFDAYYLDGRYLLRQDLELVDKSLLPAGTPIVGIDGLSIDEYISRNKENLILREDAVTGKVFAKNLLSELSEDSAIEFEVDDLGTRATVRSIDVQERSVCMTHRSSPGRYFYLDLIPGKVAYVKLDSFSGHRDDPGRASSFARFIDKHADARAIILDLRGNTGGDSSRWEKEILGAMLSSSVSTEVYYGLNAHEVTRDFIDAKIEPSSTIFPGKLAPAGILDELRRGEVNTIYQCEGFLEGKRKRPFAAKIYMLVNRDVFSSSEMFAAWAKASGWAVIVGEQTGGDGIGVDPLPAVLPNSKMAVRFPWILGASSDGAINEEQGTIPDLVTTWQVEDWRGRCEAIRKIQELDSDHGMWTESHAREVLLKHDPDVAAALRDLRRRG
jgi:C-terminal processing protease CtpA/Prc